MRTHPSIALVAFAAWTAFGSVPAGAEPLTADAAVKLALQRNSQVIQAEAGVLDARSGLWSAYSGVLPNVTGSYARSGSYTKNATGTTFFGPIPFSFVDPSIEGYSTTPGLSGRWSILNLSALSNFSSARLGMRAAQLDRTSIRNDVVLSARRQFYEVVKSYHLLGVAGGALKLSRDDERRVNALFEVGSVSKSDLLKARVRTSQSELDSLLADHAVTAQRIALANQLGVAESALGEVDTVLTATPQPVDEAAVLADARASRPDLRAAELGVKSAQAGLNAARWRRLPSIDLQGSAEFDTKSSSKTTELVAGSGGQDSLTVKTGRSREDANYRGSVALTWELFNGFSTDAGIASSRAQLLRARETRDALVRNLEGEVRQTVLGYREALERESLARRSLDAASENLKLTQQKYNVGSATILDLIDAQVQLQRAQNEIVTALAAIRVADASVEHVRGRGE